LISDDRNDIMPLWYLQYVEGRRPDLLGLFALITPEYPTLGQVLDLGQSTGRPLYLSKAMPGIEVKVEVGEKVEAGEGVEVWQVLGPAAGEAPAYPREAQLGEALALAGYDRAPRSPAPGEELAVGLYWETLAPMEEAYHSFVHLLGPEGEVVAQSDHQPGGVYLPTNLWQPGERLKDEHVLAVPPEAAEGVYQMVAGMYALGGEGSLVPLGEPILLGRLGVKERGEADAGAGAQPAAAVFGGEVALLDHEAGRRDGSVAVTLRWQCLEPPQVDYTVFVHLLDAEGRTVAQHDGQPQGGAYPTSAWDRGEVVIDEHVLSPAPGAARPLPAGSYRLEVGLYRLETGQRLPLDSGGDHLEVALQLGEDGP
jgi:hypothetical protein